MRERLLINSIAVLVLAAASAQAETIAGWDFSQYFNDGVLSIDAQAFTDILDANYSNLDPTRNAGAESAAFGTLYLNGEFGSSDVNEASESAEFVPTGAAPGSLNSNLDGIAPNPFDSHSILKSEGQQFQTFLAMTATAAVSVVFEADLSSVAEQGSDWSVSFGGKTFDGTASVGIDFSTDGVDYSSVDSVNLNTTDRPFTVSLGAVSANHAFVRFNFAAPGEAGVAQPIIDNVTIEATLGEGETDSDEDGVADDGDGSGDPSDNPCADGVTADCDDNCRYIANNEAGNVQRDANGDGIGDVCQCGDVDGNGVLNTTDALLIARGQVTDLVDLLRCDVSGDAENACNTTDALLIARGQAPAAPEEQTCPAYTGE
jgi:hypothetical protein